MEVHRLISLVIGQMQTHRILIILSYFEMRIN